MFNKLTSFIIILINAIVLTIITLVVLSISLTLYLNYFQPPTPLFPSILTNNPTNTTSTSIPSTTTADPTSQSSLNPNDFNQQIPSQSTSKPILISQSQLWNALTIYRQSHNRNSLVSEESLCIYARQRVVEHENRLLTLNKDENPLDSHSGFQRDADSDLLFEQTGFNSVSEVLAYLPNAQNATQVIEWGWDSSAPHRQGLLSNDSTHACITGTAPFFVGILGNR